METQKRNGCETPSFRRMTPPPKPAAEYIEKEALRNAVRKNSFTKYDWSEEIDVEDFEKVLDEIPAADVVPVVRCKDCKHMNIVGVGYRWCKVWERIQTMGDDGYCCFGERRADNG